MQRDQGYMESTGKGLLSWDQVCRLLGYETPPDIKDEVMRQVVIEAVSRDSRGGAIRLSQTDINQTRVIMEYFG